MKKNFRRYQLILILVLISIIICVFHYLLFNDPEHIFIYMLSDLAFLPFEIIFVTLIFDRIIGNNEKKATIKKLNMIIGVFFGEAGNQLLDVLVNHDENVATLKKNLIVTDTWNKKDFANAFTIIDSYSSKIIYSNLEDLKLFLDKNRDFLLKIASNQALLEHELFSELMMSIFHLKEELSLRDDVMNISEIDADHLNLDITRVYGMLLKEWLLYIEHLKNEYPYLFSIANRTNPFKDDAKVELADN